MPRGAGWVIVRSTHPSRGSAQIPQEVAELLGVSREDLAKATKPGRAIVFIHAGPGALRVVGARKNANLVAEAMSSRERPKFPRRPKDRAFEGGPSPRGDPRGAGPYGTAVAKATLTKTQIFNIPQAVYRHLAIRTRPWEGGRGAASSLGSPLPRRVSGGAAPSVRTRELGYGIPPGTDDQIAWALPEEEYAALRRGKPPAEPHVMLLKAHLQVILPSVDVLERGESSRSRR